MTESEIDQWAERLSAIARTGLAFTKSTYEQERFSEVLMVASEMLTREPSTKLSAEQIVEAWTNAVIEGVPGYVTPKVAVGAVVRRNQNEILLIKRADSGRWLYPTGWADIGYSPAEIALKEVKEETGVTASVIRPIAIFDSNRIGVSGMAFYSLIFLCDYVSGELVAHPVECTDVGWFTQDSLPSPLAGFQPWVDLVFRAMANDDEPMYFDEPRPNKVGHS